MSWKIWGRGGDIVLRLLLRMESGSMVLPFESCLRHIPYMGHWKWWDIGEDVEHLFPRVILLVMCCLQFPHIDIFVCALSVITLDGGLRSKYMRTPPTCYFLESSGRVAYMKNSPLYSRHYS